MKPHFLFASFLVTDAELADDLADTLALEARRAQPRTPLREVLKDLRIRV